MDTAIEVADLVVDRGRRRVLDGLSARIPAGVVTGLIGPSGSGKTTLIRAIVGTQVIRSGRVTVLATRPARRRCAGRSATSPRHRASTTT